MKYDAIVMKAGTTPIPDDHHRVFQAGYVSGNGWRACGYGKTIWEARRNLEQRLLEQQLESLCAVVQSMTRDHGPGYRMSGSDARKLVENAIAETKQAYRYEEQFFDERDGQ